MRQGWEVKTLQEVTNLITCGVAARPEYVPEGIPFLSAKNVKDGAIIWSDYKYITEEKHKELTKKNKPQIGDILYTRVGSYGEAAVIESDIEFSLFVSLTLIKPKHKILNCYFLKHYLNSPVIKELAKNNISGSGVGNLNVGTVRRFTIPIPPLSEQERIVEILDEALTGIATIKANTERNLQNVRELFQSYLQSIFSNPHDDWECCHLEKYIKFIDYRGKTPQKTDFGMRLITAKNVKQGFLQKTPEEFVDPEIYDSWMTRGIPKKGDVLFTTEAPLANVAQLDTEEKVVFAQRIIIMQPRQDKINQTFLKYLLLSQPIQRKILDKGTGTTVQGIKSALLKKIEIYFPDLQKQQKIVEKLDALSAETKKLEAIYQQKLNDLEELKKSLLQKAFNGDLTHPEKP